MQLHLSFSAGALELLKKCAKEKAVTPERFAYDQLKRMAVAYAHIEASMVARGEAPLPEGGIVVKITNADLPAWKLSEGDEGDLTVTIGPKLAARIEFAARVTWAGKKKIGNIPDWKDPRQYAEQCVTDATVNEAAGSSNKEIEDEEEAADVEAKLAEARAARRSANS